VGQSARSFPHVKRFVLYSTFCRGAEFFPATNRRNHSAQFGEWGSGYYQARIGCVVLEADRRTVALSPDCHFGGGTGIRVLGCVALESPVTKT
jgi:hypothetical protein